MPYIGNEVGNRFVASKAASVYSGNGSTTAFTLEHAVGSDEDILVSVDGVVQEPSVAYAVSSGTTLTFTAAPSSNSGNNIFVYYLFRTVATVDHPATSALSATNGTFSGNTTVAGTSTFTGDVTVGDGSAADKKILFDGNAVDYHIGLDDSSDSLIIGKGSALGTTPAITIDSSQRVLKAHIPSFCVQGASSWVDLGSSSTIYFKDSVSTVNVVSNIGSHFNTSTGRFTAPVAGTYQFNISLYNNNTGDANHYMSIFVNGSAYNNILGLYQNADSAYPDNTNTLSISIDLNASDYIEIQGTNDVYGGHSFFNGYLVG